MTGPRRDDETPEPPWGYLVTVDPYGYPVNPEPVITCTPDPTIDPALLPPPLPAQPAPDITYAMTTTAPPQPGPPAAMNVATFGGLMLIVIAVAGVISVAVWRRRDE